MGLDFQKTKYLKSIGDLNQLPVDQGSEVAFIGPSNAGKSSAMNTITGIKGLARASKLPGRTQMINFFAIDSRHRLVDLPGYGYAKVPKTMQERWSHNVNEYLQVRNSLCGLILIMDIRHPLKEMDQQLIEWTIQCDLPLHILLTKADKLNKNEMAHALSSVKEALIQYQEQISMQTFSSNKRIGVDHAMNVLNDWLS